MKIGLTLEYFWGEITPAIFRKHVQAYSERNLDAMIRADILNWQLGVYITSAVANALRDKGKQSTYPKKPLFQKKESTLKRKFTEEEIQAYLQGEQNNVTKCQYHDRR